VYIVHGRISGSPILPSSLAVWKSVAVSPVSPRAWRLGPALVLDTEGILIPIRTVFPFAGRRGSPPIADGPIPKPRKLAQEKQVKLSAKLGKEIADHLRSPTRSSTADPKTRPRWPKRPDPGPTTTYSGRIRREPGRPRDPQANWMPPGISPMATRLQADFVDLEKQLLLLLQGGIGPTARGDHASDHRPGSRLDARAKRRSSIRRTVARPRHRKRRGDEPYRDPWPGHWKSPAVVGVGRFLSDVSGGDTVIVDGYQGILILDPDEETIRRYNGNCGSAT